MNKNDLIGAVAEASGLTKSDATKAVEGVFDAISGALKSGEKFASSASAPSPSPSVRHRPDVTPAPASR